MTAFSVITILACLIVSALTIRYGNLTLQKQKAEARRRSQAQARGVQDLATKDRQSPTANTYQDAVVQLDRWRRRGLLTISEEDFEYIATKRAIDLAELQRVIRLAHISIEQGYVTPESPMRLMSVKVPDGEQKDENAAKPPGPLDPKTHPTLAFG